MQLLKNHVLNFYSSLFEEDGWLDENSSNMIKNFIPQSVTLEDNNDLTSISIASKVEKITFSLDQHSVPVPDGYTNLFYDSCWDIISTDTIETV